MTGARKITGAEDRQHVFVDASLYEEFSLEGLDDEEIRAFFFGGGTVDAYCQECGRLSTFHFSVPYRNPDEAPPAPPLNGVITKTGNCGRGGTASYNGCGGIFSASLFRSHEVLMKVGQFPSKKICDFGLLDPVFNRELEPRLRDELGAAVGLNAHGIGIGSYVYLRRLVEVLIEEAHKDARKLPGWNDEVEEQFCKSRVVDRIKLLAQVLPSRLVGGADLYSILSKGLHELSESECKENYGLVFKAIEMMLRRRADIREQAELAAKLSRKKAEIRSDSESQANARSRRLPLGR